MIALTVVSVVSDLLVLLILAFIWFGGRGIRDRNEDDRARNEKLIRENDAARKHIKRELATIKSMVAVPLSESETQAEWRELEKEERELENEGWDDLPR